MSRLMIAVLTLLAVGAMTSAGWAQTPATAADGAGKASDVPADAEKVLDRVERAGEKISGLVAEMSYERNQTLVDEVITRTGTVSYLRKAAEDKGEPPRVYFRVEFDTLTTASYTSKRKEIYVFDGRWLHELNEKARRLYHRQVVADDAKRVDPTRLGKGPFPAPFGQRKADVVENFKVRLIPPADDRKEPRNTDHLELIPREGSDLARTYEKIELFVSRELNVPVRMITRNKSQEIVTADFAKIRINPSDLTEKSFELKKPSGYDEVTEAL